MSSRINRPSLGQYDLTTRDLLPTELPRRPRNNSRLPDYEPVRIPQVQIDSSSDDDDIPAPKSKRPARHNRSMSHPFPSLFSSKKKKHNAGAENPPDDENAPDDRAYNSKTHTNQAQATNPRRPPLGPTDFATGNCMTCASLVRWPKELQVFRCTICLTINDIKPYNPSATRPTIRPVPRTPTQAQANGAGAGPSGGPPASTPHLISLEYTKTLVRTCLRTSLQYWIAASVNQPEGSSVTDPLPSSCAPGGQVASRDSPKPKGTSPPPGAVPPPFTYNAVFDDFADLNLDPNPLNSSAHMSRSYSTSYPDGRSSTFPSKTPQSEDALPTKPPTTQLDSKKMFRKLEDYIVSCFATYSCLNNSFVTRRASVSSRVPPEGPRRRTIETKREPVREEPPISELDPKLLLLGNFAENGSWWTGGQEDIPPTRASSSRRLDDKPSIVTSRSPRIDWGVAMEWYHTVINAAEPWQEVYDELRQLDSTKTMADTAMREFERSALEAQDHIQRALLKCSEVLLKRPGRLLTDPQDLRFLLLLLSNPLLYPGCQSYSGSSKPAEKGKSPLPEPNMEANLSSGRHSGIIKRILGLLANSSESCHHHMVLWLSRLPDHLFVQIKDLVGGFVTYRLSRQSEKTVEPKIDVTGGLIPQMPNGRLGNTPANLHAALEASNKSSKNAKPPMEPKRAAYTDDWQIKAGARVMALIFAANNLTSVRRNDSPGGRFYGPLLSTSDFYNSLVDCLDFKADFELWESKRGRFTFCQYPFFLSIWAKIQILEFDAKRQMAGKAREAFFDSILTHKNYTQYLVLSVRRECLVDDSLKKVSEVVGSGSEDIKKGLRIEFQGEEGVDGGGLRKEWFLLLIREVFNPDHGLFIYDEDSQFCYFNPNTFETSDQYFLVGVLLGLAIYNSTILDVALPPFAFRKLLAAAPPPAAGTPAHSRPTMTYTLDDLAEFRPALARGLRQLLEYDGDVQSIFCLDFVIEVERYGTRVRVPLCPGGETKMVTSANRREYVDLYVRYLLDTSVSRQFEPFKRGFFTVCAGNALTLFRPEEIELLIRGSDEPLDITSLKAVATYTNWPKHINPEADPPVRWFWDTFERSSPKDQRKLLSFITGSDRIPAMGATSLVIKINCLGDDEGRYPSARTCFNTLSLYRYRSRARLEQCLWRAVNESEGFGLK